MKITDRKTHDFRQGDDAWHAHRRGHYNASLLAAAMGIDPNKPRNDLVRALATGDEQVFTDFQQKILEDGHVHEAAARPIAEAVVEEDLFPIVVSATVDGLQLSASVDGATMAHDVIWEHKSAKVATMAALAEGRVPDHHKPQLEQCLLLTGAKRALFMASNGTEESARHVWYESDPAWRAKIIPTWKQLAEDVENYKHVDTPAAPVVAAPDELPSLAVTLFGGVRESNLADWKVIVTARIQAIKTDLSSDEDFALAAKTVTFLETGEKKLELVKEQALSQTASIDELFRTIDALKKEMRAKRLTLSNTITERKQTVRDNIITEGREEFGNHVAALARRIGQIMPYVSVDFAGVCKGKSAIASLRNAVATELARAKIEANAVAERIDINRTVFGAMAGDYRSLFPDLSDLANNPLNAFEALVKQRIADHMAEQERRAAVKREMEAKAADAQRAREANTFPAPQTLPANARAAPIPQPANWGLPKGGLAAIAVPVQPTPEEMVTCIAEGWNVNEALAAQWLASINWSERRAAA